MKQEVFVRSGQAYSLAEKVTALIESGWVIDAMTSTGKFAEDTIIVAHLDKTQYK